jgi:ribonuclease HI
VIIEVYTDGSGTDGSSNGGWGFVICVDGVKVAEGSGSILRATNNVAEVTAAIRGLEYIAGSDVSGIDVGSRETAGDNASEQDKPRILLVSDSQLTLKWATGEYNCKKWHLIPHVIKLRGLVRKLEATTRWVKGHNGNEHNERCDVLAGQARQLSADDKVGPCFDHDVG